jgi:NitT/TauT family transport system ATP-binding protein
MTVEPLLKVSGLTYNYPNGLSALGGVDLELGDGEIIAIVGPSGCGKSTLLGVLAGLSTPSSGSIIWNEDRLAVQGHLGRRLAMVFQRDTIFPWRTVEKNVRFGMECLGIPIAEQQERTNVLLKIANLEEFAKAHPSSLSGGMRRRVGLLMALAVRPSVLLLDEPFGALDEPTRVDLTADVLKLAYEYGVSVILVTHDLGEAISIADRIYVFSNRPATVNKAFDVNFGHDRDIYTVRETAHYAQLYGELWHLLWATIKGGSPV